MKANSPRVEALLPSDGRWMALLGRCIHDFYHLPGYAETCAKPIDGAEAIAFDVQEGERHLFLPMILRPLPDFGDPRLQGWRDASSPYGYPGPLLVTGDGEPGHRASFAAEAVRALLQHMQQLRILTAFVRFHPLLDTPLEAFSTSGEVLLHGRTVSIDLQLPEEQIWRDTRRNHRTQITQLKEAGAEAIVDPDWRHLDAFLAAYQATMDRVRAQQSYYFERSYYEGLRRALGERAHLFVLKLRDRTAAAAIITEVCGIVQFHLAATFSEFVSQHPQKLLFHEVCRWAKHRGNRVLHLGGGLGGKEDELYHFKAGFSPLRHPFHTWRARCEPGVYDRALALWQERARPASVDPSFFPPYRQLQASRADQVGC